MLYLGVPVCKECGFKFPNWAVVDSCKRNLQKRHYCLTCSPYGKREKNLRPLLGIKHCPACNDDLPSSDFYVRSAPSRHGHLSLYCKKCSGLQVTLRQQQLKKLCVAYKVVNVNPAGMTSATPPWTFTIRIRIKKTSQFLVLVRLSGVKS